MYNHAIWCIFSPILEVEINIIIIIIHVLSLNHKMCICIPRMLLHDIFPTKYILLKYLVWSGILSAIRKTQNILHIRPYQNFPYSWQIRQTMNWAHEPPGFIYLKLHVYWVLTDLVGPTRDPYRMEDTEWYRAGPLPCDLFDKNNKRPAMSSPTGRWWDHQNSNGVNSTGSSPVHTWKESFGC